MLKTQVYLIRTQFFHVIIISSHLYFYFRVQISFWPDTPFLEYFDIFEAGGDFGDKMHKPGRMEPVRIGTHSVAPILTHRMGEAFICQFLKEVFRLFLLTSTPLSQSFQNAFSALISLDYRYNSHVEEIIFNIFERIILRLQVPAGIIRRFWHDSRFT